jgi:hypothetical protein
VKEPEGSYEEVADIISSIVRPYVLTYEDWRQGWLGRRVLAGLRGMGDE